MVGGRLRGYWWLSVDVLRMDVSSWMSVFIETEDFDLGMADGR